MPSVRNSAAPALRRGLLRCLVLSGAVTAVAASVLVSPAVASADAGTTTTVVGRLMQAWPETEYSGAGAATQPQGLQTWVQAPDGAMLSVSSEDLAGVPLDATVSVTVPGAGDGTTPGDGSTDTGTGDTGRTGTGGTDGAADQSPALPVLNSAVVAPPPALPVVPARAVTNQVTVVMVAPAGSDPDGTSAEQIRTLVDGDVSAFWAEQTDGAVRIGVTEARDWLRTTADCSSAATLWNEVAAKVRFTAGPGKHLLLYLPRTLTSCEYALAEVGRATTSGGRVYVRDATASVIAHELGHNFGLGHSSGRQCDATVDAGTCRTAPYRDFYDVMGVSWGRLGTLNAVQASTLKVLPATAQQSLSVWGSATAVTLSPLSGRRGTRALRLTDAAGVDYWLEYRPAAGRDAWLASTDNRYGVDSGVLLHRAGAFPDTSLLLDGTPAGSTGWDDDLRSALPVGAAVPLAGGQFSVVVQGVSTLGAVVRVVPTPPTTTAAPAPPPAGAGAGAGQLLAQQPAPAAHAPKPAPGQPAAPALPEVATAHVSPVLQAAAETSSRSGVALAAAGALLGAVLLVIVRRTRTARSR